MKILKLLSKKNFFIILIFFFLQVLKVYSNEPVDIWNIKTPKPEIKKDNIEINLGKYNGKDVIIKNGPYGYYVTYCKKNTSLKYILKNKEIKDIKVIDIQRLLDK